ncbi:hypothetical protein ncot_11745 [Nocardioides sp. JQ2195]|uniref:hypothetical protein n=1 Tax=Nocardioides sp. JQ2195 TaxID=2592334 RepID=UPI00143E15C4|nr:hypothetical protein [Nocardioides sp. JQ2195]QIX27196.1 hypothetical protein ncot_11745 [Nocardioides sp. JQ2195]
MAESAEEHGLLEYESEFEVSVDRGQVVAHVNDLANGRFFDGMALKDDGTYEGVDVLYGDEERSSTQVAFDESISVDSPAQATLVSGETVDITSVVVVRVPA